MASRALHLTAYLLGIGTLLATGLLSAQQFTQETTTRFPQPDPLEYSSQVAIEDIDADGDLDVVFANGRGFFSPQLMERVRVLVNDGDGFFTDETDARTGGLIGYGRDVEFGDVDGDGDPDLVVANDFNTRPRLLLNDGAGFFTDETLLRFPVILLSSSHAAFGDVDNDGDLDLWFTKGGSSRFGAGQAQLWINDGAGFYTDMTSTLLPAQLINSPMDCIFGDLDGDFDLDMVEGHRDTRSRLFINDGTGAFTDETIGNLPVDNATYSYDLGDLDDDGDLDLLGVNSSPTSSREVLLLNDGTASFTDMTSTLIPLSSHPPVDDNDSKFFDIDDDGDLDFIIASLGSTERILVNNGSQFIWMTSLISPVSDASLDVELGDLDGNGTLDVVTAQGESGNFTNRVYMNSGPADTRAPTFPNLELLPDTTDATGPYVVRVVIRDGMTSDHNFFMQDRALAYSVDGGPDQTTPLVWSGGDVYRAEIPGQPFGSSVAYHATATDFAGNSATSTSHTFAVTLPFDRGDCNGDDAFDIADPVALLGALFSGGGEVLACEDACDGNDDGELDVADPVSLLSSLFSSAGPLPAPHGSCGSDPTPDALTCAAGPCP